MIKRGVLIFLLYLGMSVIVTWPLVPLAWDHVINAGDPLFYAWNLMHNVRSATNGFINLLDTNIYYPTTNTLALSDTLAAQTLLAFPIIWLTNNPVLAINLYTIVTFPIAGLGMYLLVHSLVKHEWASIVSGAIFAFSYPRFGQISHLPALSSQWLPYYVYGLYWFFSKGKLLHLFIGLASFFLLLGSSVYLGVFAIVVGLIMTPAFLASLRARLKTAAIPLACTAVLSVLLMYPYIRLKAEHPEITRSLAESSARAAYQQDYTSVTNSSLLAKFLKNNEGERTLYPTLIALSLAAVGFSLKFPVALFPVIALIGLVLSFGPERPFSFGPFHTGYITLPYAYLYNVFPLLQILRVPARFSIVFILGLSVLAGYGAAKAKRLILFLMVIAFLFEIWQRPSPLIKIPTYANVPLIYQWLKKQPNVKAIIELPIGKIEEGTIPIEKQVTLRYEDVNEDSPLVAETYRVYFAGFHNKKTVNGYSGYVPQSYQDAIANMASFPSSASINYLRSQGVSHIVVHPWQLTKEKRGQYIIDPNHPELSTAFATVDGDIVYEIKPM